MASPDCSWPARWNPAVFFSTALVAVLALAGCGGGPEPAAQTNSRESLIPLTPGRGAAFRPSPYGAAAARAAPVAGLACGRRPAKRHGAHLELFARRHVVLVPAGIGVAPPQQREG